MRVDTIIKNNELGAEKNNCGVERYTRSHNTIPSVSGNWSTLRLKRFKLDYRFLFCFVPVSYTHLDVYKRQALGYVAR